MLSLPLFKSALKWQYISKSYQKKSTETKKKKTVDERF